MPISGAAFFVSFSSIWLISVITFATAHTYFRASTKNGMKQYINILALTLLIFLFSGCDKYEGGVWEFREQNATTFYSGNIYRCFDDDDYFTEETENRVFHKGRSCPELGYSKYNDTIQSYVNEKGKYFPGKNGKWGSGNGVACSPQGYTGPTADVQSASFCEQAYVYQCQGIPEGVTSVCNTYKTFQSITPGLPDCPYCN